MSIAINKELSDLVQSLSKSEKRFFKVHFATNQEQETPLFIQLFDFIEKGNQQIDRKDDLYILKGMKLSNLSRHLHKVLMKSLRLQRRNKQNEVQLSEWVDHARILYNKGLYKQSLKILDRALDLALKSEVLVLQLEIIEFEKRIEARHITRSRKIRNKVETLIKRSDEMSKQLRSQVQLSNFSLKIHGFYINHGLAKSTKDIKRLKTYFLKHLPNVDVKDLAPVEQAYYFQGYLWFHYILSNTTGVYKYALKWLNIYKRNPTLLIHDPIPYLRSLHYLVNTSFYSGKIKRLQQYSKELDKDIKGNAAQTPTVKMLSFVYRTNAKLNIYLLKGDYRKGTQLADYIRQNITDYQTFIDPHRVIIFHYKLAWLHFGINDYDTCIDYLNEIISMRTTFLREDISCYVRLLQLCTHHAMKNERLTVSLLKATRKAFQKSGLDGPLVLGALNLIQEDLLNRSLADNAIPEYISKFSGSMNLPLQRYQGIYFNFYNWAQSWYTGWSIEKIRRKQYIERK